MDDQSNVFVNDVSPRDQSLNQKLKLLNKIGQVILNEDIQALVNKGMI
jgi:hypothetical protein